MIIWEPRTCKERTWATAPVPGHHFLLFSQNFKYQQGWWSPYLGHMYAMSEYLVQSQILLLQSRTLLLHLGSRGTWPKYLSPCHPHRGFKEFLNTGFYLVQHWLLWPSGDGNRGWEISLSLSLSLALSSSLPLSLSFTPSFRLSLPSSISAFLFPPFLPPLQLIDSVLQIVK